MPTRLSLLLVTVVLALLLLTGNARADDPSYAQRLGWASDDRLVIFHIDDAGMSHSSNRGSIKAIEQGVANSVSTMMPCSWVPAWAKYLDKNPEVDNGLHLTLTSEWDNYRWGPLAGAATVPGLVDEEGCLWNNVPLVIAHATADEVETEIRAQVARAEKMGMPITHIDSHMGTLFASPLFFERYLKVGAEKGYPILVAGGHLQYLSQEGPIPTAVVRQMARKAWEAGLPVLDDIHTNSYDWDRDEKTDRFIEVLRGMQPGILEIVIHATDPSDVFPEISGSSATRKGDMEAMIDPRLAAVIEEEGIILTTWRELKERRDKVAE
ncbi:MAG: polysaccharide deacetylase family protein [Candidatus Hydrogenedentota bacterium]